MELLASDRSKFLPCTSLIGIWARHPLSVDVFAKKMSMDGSIFSELPRWWVFKKDVLAIHQVLGTLLIMSMFNAILVYISILLVSISSMYGIFTYIYHKSQPHVGKYASPMGPMGWNRLEGRIMVHPPWYRWDPLGCGLSVEECSFHPAWLVYHVLYKWLYYPLISGQIIATSHDLTPKRWFSKRNPSYFREI